jgi:hypothetical protein
MTDKNKKQSKRQYPPIYEKIVPVALGLIGLAIIILLVITILVAVGAFQ